MNSLLEDITSPTKLPDLPRLSHLSNLKRRIFTLALLVPDRQLARLDRGAVACWRVEGWDAECACAALFYHCALWCQLERDFAVEELLLKVLVGADEGGDHLADLTRVQEFPWRCSEFS